MYVYKRWQQWKHSFMESRGGGKTTQPNPRAGTLFDKIQKRYYEIEGGVWRRELPLSLLLSLAFSLSLSRWRALSHDFPAWPQCFSISFELSFACVHARVFFHSFSFSFLLHHCSSLPLSFSLFLSLSLSVCKYDQTRANIIGEPNKKHFSKQDHSLAKQLNHIPHADGHFPYHNTFIIFLQLLLLLVKSISLALCQTHC